MLDRLEIKTSIFERPNESAIGVLSQYSSVVFKFLKYNKLKKKSTVISPLLIVTLVAYLFHSGSSWLLYLSVLAIPRSTTYRQVYKESMNTPLKISASNRITFSAQDVYRKLSPKVEE